MIKKGIFTDNKGNFKEIDEVVFDDLKKLIDIDEGYIVEYKVIFDSNVKKKIPQIITSFANSDGGWLIVGIDNNTHNISKIQEEKTDFDVIITSLLEKVTPKPKYEARFIKENKNDKDGVLVVYIYRGENTPYVANGTVYVRNGSSKIPILSDRATIDELYKRRETLKNKKKDFASEKIDVNYTGAILNIYMYNLECESRNSFFNKTRKELNNIKERVLTVFPKSVIYPSIQSIIIKNTDFIDKKMSTVYIEIFDNSNVKISVPLELVDYSTKEDIINEITKLRDNYNEEKLEEYIFLNGNMIWITIYNSFLCLEKYFEAENISVKDYQCMIDFQNTNNTILFLNTKDFRKTIKTNGISAVNRENFKTEYLIFPTVNSFSEIGIEIFWQMVLQYWGICAEEQVNSIKELSNYKDDDIEKIES